MSKDENPLSRNNDNSIIETQNKPDITDTLKQDYKINKNISRQLSPAQREELLILLRENDTVSELVNALVSKHSELRGRSSQKGKKHNEEIRKQSAEIEIYHHKLQKLTVEKQRAIEKRDQAKRELDAINTEVKLAVERVKHEKTIWGKFSKMVNFLRALFVDEDEIQEILKTDYSDPDKPQMNTDIASIQRDLLDR